MRRLLFVALLIVACAPSNQSAETPTTTTTTTTTIPPTTTSTTVTSTTAASTPATTASAEFDITSPAFAEGETIPVVHTCDGDDVSPALEIVGIPRGTESLVLIVDDPDAALGTWDHWVVYDIPAVPGSIDIDRATGPGGGQGVNSWNLQGYMGPCPPKGEEHSYSFEVYALEASLGLPTGAESAEVYETMEGRVIDSVALTGVYAR